MSAPAGLAFDLRLQGDVLTVAIHRDFDTGSLHQDWSSTICNMMPGPYREVVVDLSRTGLLSSTFFAGVIRLHQHYARLGPVQIVLHHPDARTVRNLRILRMDALFRIEPRA